MYSTKVPDVANGELCSDLCGVGPVLYGSHHGCQVTALSLFVWSALFNVAVCFFTVVLVLFVGSNCLLNMDCVMETLLDGTEAHGLEEVAESLYMRCVGCRSDFISSDAIFAEIFEEIMNCCIS